VTIPFLGLVGNLLQVTITQVPLGGRLFAQLAKSSMTQFGLHAFAEFVRLAQEAPGSSLLGAMAFVVHFAFLGGKVATNRSQRSSQKRSWASVLVPGASTKT
jgi:hypothetical protein